MRVAILTNLYPPFVRGGAEYLAHELAQELVRQGHRVTVLTSAPFTSVQRLAPELREEGGVRVYRFFPPNLYHYLSASRIPYALRLVWHLVNLFNLPAARTITAVLRAEAPDVVVSANLVGLTFLAPRAVARLGLKHIHVLHDVQLLHPSGLFLLWQRRSPLAMAPYQALTRWLFACTGTVVSPSRWLLGEHLRRGFFARAQQVVLPNPVPPAHALPATKTTKRPLRLLYVGQLEDHKGVPWLLQALERFPRQDFELHLYALGQKPKLEQVREHAARDRRLVLHDLPSQQEVDQAYARAHLVVVPSLCFENSPVAIPRAFAAAVPVLAARAGGIPELVRVGETGWLFRAGDTKSFLEQLSWCLDHPAEMLRVGLTASRAPENYTLERYAQQIVALAS